MSLQISNMSKYDFLTDEYVADILAKDAKESSIRYSSIGPQAYTSPRPPINKPKPNTRFLQNIIKNTDNHNAALLARETAEAHKRLKTLQGTGSEKVHVSRKTICQNQVGEIEAILGGISTKRKRLRETSLPEGHPRNSDRKEEYQRKSKSYTRVPDEIEKKTNYEKQSVIKDTCSKDINGKSEKSEKHTMVKDRRFKGLIDVLRDKERQRENFKSHKTRSQSLHESRSDNRNILSEFRSSRSTGYQSSRKKHCDQSSKIEECVQHGDRSQNIIKNSRSNYESSSESDALDETIGPFPLSVPKVYTRGRGNFSGAADMDSRFSAVYDPSKDFQIDFDGENDWDEAVEAFRDRQKFKEKGIERLRTAGFTEEEIKRLERGGEKCEQDVHWSMPGEKREWDRGKVVEGITGL